ncbi:IclR family transcriptional regulator [Aminipila luticellarii]|uniref:IclR family transcriptional regulator n=1 Tax=Aminipila luticellarii TaxID=2507160 RepID=A0A410PT64_9FIRM|nr:IclR family transcriptional regulator [Aminipila luticellarii]QAT42090.1 IclR family transcriptional regulator [Aminipila luticellarii]
MMEGHEENLLKKFGAIEKMLELLNAFTASPYTYSAKELSEKLGFTKPTVHRILNALEKENYVRRSFDGKYTIGYKAYQVGMIYANNTDLYMEIRKVIENIAGSTGEQVGYAVLEGTDALSIYESQMQDSRIRYVAGAVYPINSGCYGKVLMAFSHTEEELCEIVPKLELKQVSRGAIMDPQELLEEYRNIRKSGYGESADEYLDGTVGLGVPVFKQNGSLAGCISLGAIKSDRFCKLREQYLKELFKGAGQLKNVIW